MSAFMDQKESETLSRSAKATVLRSNSDGGSPSSRDSKQIAELDVKQACVKLFEPPNDVGLRSVLECSSHEEDADGKSASALELRHHGVNCETNFHRCSEGKASCGFGATSEDTPASKVEHNEIRAETKEPCPTSRCDGSPALTHSTPGDRENRTDPRHSLTKKTPCVGGTCQSRSASWLSPKQTCAIVAPDENHSRGRKQQEQEDSEDKRRDAATLSADSRARGKSSRCTRPPPPESRTTSGNHETSRRFRGTQGSRVASKVEKGKNPSGSAAGVANASGPSSEKEADVPKRSSQQPSAIHSVRRPLIHKTGKRFPVQHSTSSRSLPGSRRTSLFNSIEAEKKLPALSRGSTMDTEGTSTTFQAACKRNFIRENMQNACVQQHQRQTKPAKGKPEAPRRHSSFGKIPEYLSQIKSQLREEAKKALDKEAADKLPPGMRVMGNEERLETVRRLKKEQNEAEQELARMPIAIKTNAQRRRMEYLERRLGELDREQQKYSKPNILVGV